MTDFRRLPDLASRLVGGSVVFATDELFAAKENLILPESPTFSPRTFGLKGQIYDGWETRRRRSPGFDYAIVRLGMPGVVRGVVVDTSHFTGNYPPEVSVEGVAVEGYPSPDDLTGWTTLVPRTAVLGDRENAFPVDVPDPVTHVRLCIYPDGGVARLRVHGNVVPDPRLLGLGVADLAALENGGTVVAASDEFYGSPQNLLMPGRARSMGEGWETRRRRDPGNEWVVVRLGAPGVIRLAEIDTTCFVGNAPGSVRLTGRIGDGEWVDLLPTVRVQPDTVHRFWINAEHQVGEVRLDVFPDGGMARLRLWGSPQV